MIAAESDPVPDLGRRGVSPANPTGPGSTSARAMTLTAGSTWPATRVSVTPSTPCATPAARRSCAVRLVEIRLLDGPNVYRLEPTVKVEVAVGRRRTWFGQRLPAAYARVRLGAPVPRSAAPRAVVDLAAGSRALHRLSGADAWLVDEGRAASPGRARIPVHIHRTSEPGVWVVAYPWREDGRARAIAEAALRLVDLDLDPRHHATGDPPDDRPRRPVADAHPRARSIREAGTRARLDPRPGPACADHQHQRHQRQDHDHPHDQPHPARSVVDTWARPPPTACCSTSRCVESGDLTGPYGARRCSPTPPSMSRSSRRRVAA